MSLDNNSQLSSIGQSASGRSFVAIAVDVKQSDKDAFLVLGLNRQGAPVSGRLSRSGNAGSGVRAERFEFDMALAEIDHFEIGTRPIRTMQWSNVVLPE
jgi:hypothetical protein